MTRGQKLLVILIVCVPVLLITGIAVLHIRRQAVHVLDSSEWLVADVISRHIGREVRIGKAGLTPLGRLVLEDVSIAQGPSFAQGKLATARRVAAAYDYSGILFQKAGASGVTSVEVIEPRIWVVRQRDGTLNISDLLIPKPGPARPPFAGKIKITGGTAVFRDYLRMPLGTVRATTLRQINVDVDAHGARLYRFSFDAKGSPGRVMSARGSGVYDLDTKDLWLDASGAGIDAAFMTKSIGWPGWVDISSGSVNLAADGLFSIKNGVAVKRVTGLVRASGLTGIPSGLKSPTRNVNGVAILGGQTVMLDLTGVFGGARTKVRGSVSDFTRPVLNLVISGRDISVPELARAANVTMPRGVDISRISLLSAQVLGPTGSPRLEAVASVPQVWMQGYLARDIKVSLGYYRGAVDVRSVDLVVNGARVRARGAMGLAVGGSVEIEGQARGIDFSRLPLASDYGLSGRGDADFTVTGSVSDPVIHANAVARDTRIKDVFIGTTEGDITLSKSGAVIRRLRTTGFAGGSVAGSGTFDGRRLNLRVAGAGLQMADIGRLLRRKGLSGVTYVSGSVHGTLDSPVFDGLVEGFGLRYLGHGVDYARAAVSANQESVDVRSAVVRWFPAEVRLSGRVKRQDANHLAFDAAGNVDRLNLQRVLAAVGKEFELAGAVGGEFSASGVYTIRQADGQSPFKDTVAYGSVRLQDGTAFRYPVDDAVAQWSFRDDVLTLSETVIASEPARLVVGGNVYVGKRELDLDFSLSDFDLTRIRERIPDYVSVSGSLNATGTASGPWNAVRLEVSSGIQEFVVNQLRLDQAALQAAYSGTVLSSAQLDLTRGLQQCRIRLADTDVSARRIGSGTIEVAGASVPDLWEALKASPYLRTERGWRLRQMLGKLPPLTSGSIDASASISGPLDGLDGSITAKASDVGLDIERLETVELEASAEDGAVILKQLRATSGDTYLAASGSPLYKDGQLQLALSVNNVDIARLKPWMKNANASGIASVELEATGSAKAPDVTMSVEVVNPGVAGFSFDRLRAGRIDIAGGKISFPDPDSGIILAETDHQVVVHGFVPWDWRSLSVPRDQALEVSAELENEDMSVLAAFAPLVDSDKTKGPIDIAAFRVGGTLAAPAYDGLLQLNKGQLALKGFSSEFQDISVDMAFDGNRVLVNELSAKSSLGGIMAVAPGSILAISGKDAGVRMMLLANGLKLEEHEVLGLKETIAARMDVGLTVTGSLAHPMIADARSDDVNTLLQGLVVPQGFTVPKGIRLSDSLIRFAVPEKMGESVPLRLPFSPEFDVGLEIGRDVNVQPPSMNLMVGGGGRATGTLDDPSRPMDLSMEVKVRDGSMYLANTRFKVASGSAVDIHYAPPAEPSIKLRGFKASTSLTASNALGQKERYQINMTATGPVDNMQIDLSSNPAGLSRQQILAAMGRVEGIFNTGTSGLQDEVASAITATATSTLFRPIERVFTERFGFEQFTLEYSTLEPLSLYASSRLLNNLYISYYQRLQSKISEQAAKRFDIRASWRFRPLYELSIGTDDQEVSTFSLGFTRLFN